MKVLVLFLIALSLASPAYSQYTAPSAAAAAALLHLKQGQRFMYDAVQEGMHHEFNDSKLYSDDYNQTYRYEVSVDTVDEHNAATITFSQKSSNLVGQYEMLMGTATITRSTMTPKFRVTLQPDGKATKFEMLQCTPYDSMSKVKYATGEWIGDPLSDSARISPDLELILGNLNRTKVIEGARWKDTVKLYTKRIRADVSQSASGSRKRIEPQPLEHFATKFHEYEVQSEERDHVPCFKVICREHFEQGSWTSDAVKTTYLRKSDGLLVTEVYDSHYTGNKPMESGYKSSSELVK